MPIYAYRCESCGHTQDILQKLADPHLTECTVCHAPAFKRQLTAAGFQLKGSGWYVTDFKEGNKKPATAASTSTPDAPATKEPAAPATAAAPAVAAAAPAAPAASPPPAAKS